MRAAVASAHREEWAAVVAATVRVTRDLDLAEDCAQDAFAAAVQHWPREGVPHRPGAWLTTVARRRALDALRRGAVGARTLPLLAVEEKRAPDPADVVAGGLDDDRLRLILTCCHPALDRSAQVALTLRLVCGLSTAEVARAFLVQESAMAARLTRAKKKIAQARIPFRAPAPEELDERLDGALAVVHLVVTTGHTAFSGEALHREDLLETGTRLARLLHDLVPRDPRVSGLLALVLLTDARRTARLSPAGEAVLLAQQDRGRWDQGMIAEGAALVERSLRAGITRYGIQAAIAATHAAAPSWEETDWPEILALYDELLARWPSPVVALNRAVALSYRDGPAAGLAALEALRSDPIAEIYPYLAAAEADMLRRLGRRDEAAQACASAIALTRNEVEKAQLQAQLRELTGQG
ncbi:RNA polymerase sigma factor [Brachybacterium phenoliresistens]|uniref:RNA polymerase sigma factor n=1 Tax=Brachybacterium phenoliresistens TaxID=396014 RepID=UPI0004AEEA51|nr:sigma-70 family RNA polymerase sigma factor [Brachybacterium phenoliresistens]